MKKLMMLGIVVLVGLGSISQAAVLDDAVSRLYSNGYTIFSKTKDYQPNNYMRRDEAAKFFVKVAEKLSRNEYVKTEQECNFNDLNDGHADLKDIVIKSCRLGIFQGHEGKFMPTWALTNSQALAVMLRITFGHESESGLSYRADNYYKKAQTLGRLSQLPVLNNKEGLGTRGAVAQLVYNYFNQSGGIPSETQIYQGNDFSFEYPSDGQYIGTANTSLGQLTYIRNYNHTHEGHYMHNNEWNLGFKLLSTSCNNHFQEFGDVYTLESTTVKNSMTIYEGSSPFTRGFICFEQSNKAFVISFDYEGVSELYNIVKNSFKFY